MYHEKYFMNLFYLGLENYVHPRHEDIASLKKN
jgi:hypothetical protein